jgi:hypothetical protein
MAQLPKDSQWTIRIDGNDRKILDALKDRLPGKTESEITRTAWRMLAVELGVSA